MTDLLITSPLDQETPTDGTDALAFVDEKINEAIEKQDVDIAFQAIRALKELARLSGLGLAKALYTIHKHWDVFSTSDDFVDRVFTDGGIHSYTAERYIKVWTLFEQGYIPEELTLQFKQKNIKDLIPIGYAIAQGYDIDENDWEELANCHDYTTTNKYVRDNIKEAKPRKSSLQIQLKRDGTIRAIKGGKIENVGFLDVKSDNTLIQQTIERIKKNSHMLEE